jgi:hypothetical protein
MSYELRMRTRNRKRVGQGRSASPCQPARRSQNEGGARPAGAHRAAVCRPRVLQRRSFCVGRFAGANETVTMRPVRKADIIDAPCYEATPHGHPSSMLGGAKSCIIRHENASSGCGSHCLRGRGENHASSASGSHCLRKVPCILGGADRSGAL